MHAHINISVQSTDQQLYIQKLANNLQINQFYESIVQFNYLLLSLFTYIKFMDYRNDKVLFMSFKITKKNKHFKIDYEFVCNFFGITCINDQFNVE